MELLFSQLANKCHINETSISTDGLDVFSYLEHCTEQYLLFQTLTF